MNLRLNNKIKESYIVFLDPKIIAINSNKLRKSNLFLKLWDNHIMMKSNRKKQLQSTLIKIIAKLKASEGNSASKIKIAMFKIKRMRLFLLYFLGKY